MPANVATPIVVSLGTAGQRDLTDFRNGTGRIAQDVDAVMKLVRERMEAEQDNRVLLPVVVVYEG